MHLALDHNNAVLGHEDYGIAETREHVDLINQLTKLVNDPKHSMTEEDLGTINYVLNFMFHPPLRKY